MGGGAGRRVRSVRSTRRTGFRAKVRRPSRGLIMSVLCSFRVGGIAISKFHTFVHYSREGRDVPPLTAGASLVPSLDDVMSCQPFVPPVDVTSVQFAPEFAEAQMLPRAAAAVSLVPSLDDRLPYRFFVLPVDVTSFSFFGAKVV